MNLDAASQARNGPALLLAARAGDTAVLAALLAAGTNANFACSKSGETALSLAAQSGRLDAVCALLLQTGIHLNHADHAGKTALLHAVLINHPGIAACLLGAGAYVNLANPQNGDTPLTIAAMKGHAEVVRLLLTQDDIAVDQADHQRVTPLCYGVANGHADIVAALLAAGAQVHLADLEQGEAALGSAVRLDQDVALVRMLLDQPAIDVDQADLWGATALMKAARKRNPAYVACLLDAGADMTRVNQSGESALQTAIKKGRAGVVEVFLQHGAALNYADCYPEVPTIFSVAIADLAAERNTMGPVVLDLRQPLAFFSALAGVPGAVGSTQNTIGLLLQRGMLMSGAQQVAAALAPMRAAWQLAPGQAASAQQRIIYTLSALSRPGALGISGRVLESYRAAGISNDAVERLTAISCTALERISALATRLIAQVGSTMLGGLLPRCLATVSLTYSCDAAAMTATLIQEGYCAPVAQAIAQGWQSTLAQLQEMTTAVAAGRTIKQLLQHVSDQTAQHAPALFALALQRQLNAQDRLTQLRAMLGQRDDEGLHALFQIQCDQLRQFCTQLLDDKQTQ